MFTLDLEVRFLSEISFLLIAFFGRGLQYAISCDQKPFLWNYSMENAVRLLELMKQRKKYSHLDIPSTAEVTAGFEEDKYKAKDKLF